MVLVQRLMLSIMEARLRCIPQLDKVTLRLLKF